MKNYKEVVGIDVSKKTIDAYCHQAEVHKEFVNDLVGYRSLLKWVLKETKESSVFYCFENTGYYSLKLALYLNSQDIVYVEESPLKIKRCSGIVKEKTDRLDANVIHDFKVPKEKVHITAAYNFFTSWAESGGVEVKDWYKDNPGNRNASQIQN